jgi:molybdate transport system ATP-binding protein
MVSLQLGQARLLARITAHSAQQLAIVPGLHVFAQIKGMALLD